jgi:DNA-binding transcriptional LysR family regulator
MVILPNLRALRAFVAIATGGSVSAAARALHVSQPAVTQAVAGLEHQLGVSLFVRSSGGMTPTAEGRVLLARARRLFDQLTAGLQEPVVARDAPLRVTDGDPLRSVTVAQLRALVAVDDTGSFAAAARALQISRAALHRAARSLERAACVELFERTSFGVRPTRQAAELARRIRLATAEYVQAREEIGAHANPVQGRTVIGAMALARSWLVPQAVLGFSALWPDHAVSILEGAYEALLDALRHGKADLLVGALRDPAPASDVVQQRLFDDPLAIVMRSAHPLARQRRATVRELASFPWIVGRAGSPLRQRFVELFAGSGVVPPSNPVECNSLAAARELLMGSDRMMLASAQQVRRELDTGLLALLPHPHGTVTRSIGLTVRRDWQPTERQRVLLELLRVTAESTSTPRGAVTRTRTRRRT